MLISQADKRKCQKPAASEHFQLLRNRNGQVAIEFIVLIVLLFSIFMVYTVSTRKQMDDIRDKKEYVLLKDVTRMAQNEILTALRVEDGYIRKFELPPDLDGINYTINITGPMILANTENHERAIMIPNVTGTLQKGDNTITKQNGIISIS